jgi:hypothetical protein
MHPFNLLKKILPVLAIIGMLFGTQSIFNAKAQTTTITLNPEADAYVNESATSTNYGSSAYLRLDGSPVENGYLRFNVSGLNGAKIVSANLKVYANSGSSVGYTVYSVANTSWSESAVNYSSIPAQGSAIKASGKVTAAAWNTIDVTSFIKGEGKFSLELATSDTTKINLASRESGSNAPKLVITTDTGATATPVQPTSPAPPAPPAATATPSGSGSGGDSQPSFPIRAAFYYPWFPEAWDQSGINPYTNYHPSLGSYNGADINIIKQHIAAMQYGNIQTGIASWWGQGSQTDGKVNTLLSAAAGTSFRWSLYYEAEGSSNPSASQITSDLTYIKNHYASNPSFWRINGKFVVFVYGDPGDACGMADRWKQANTVNAYVVLKVFPGFDKCANQPDTWHQYSPAVDTSHQAGYSYSIAAGFWKVGTSVRLARDLSRWTADVKAMVASNEKLQLVTTFNEWGEGTAIESAKEWASASGYGAYLDALHNNGNSSAPPQPTATKVPANPTATGAPATATSLPPPATGVAPTSTSLPATTTSIAPTGTGVPPTATSIVPTGTQVPPTATSVAPMPTKVFFSPTPSASDPVLVGAGDIAICSLTGRTETAALLAQTPFSAIFTAGDNSNESGTMAQYTGCFGTTWGKYMQYIHPTAGNHDASGYPNYYTYFGAAAGPAGKGWYSYDLGSWQIIMLNTGCTGMVGPCNDTAGSAQEQWLKADLAAHSNKCTMAIMHQPRFSSGYHGSSTAQQPLWQDLYNAGADVVVDGHDHDYERFAPQDPTGKADATNGIREFVTGTGGAEHRDFNAPIANSQVRIANVWGIMKFTLHASSYDWQFIPVAGQTATDSGSASCH